jgi:hypothetical protein
MGKDATGHIRGAGAYSRSYPTLAKPKLEPTTARDVYGAIDGNGSRNGGFAAPIGKGKPGPDRDD